MPKNIVICCDGTGNKFGACNTNIVKLCEVLDRSREDQVVYYDPGVGTMGDQHALTRIRKRFTRALGGAIGYGLTGNVQEAYDFIAWHHRPGDRLFLFGFSRGAYTVRALAALIHMYGITGPGTVNLSPYVVGMQTGREDGAPASAAGPNRWETAASFKKIFGRPARIRFLGVFDTVSSVGWFWNPLSLPFTAWNPSVQCVRHAVAIDERRAFFRQNLFREVNGQDFKEVWFAGVHSDIGGGYTHPQQGLAQIAFEWMIHEAAANDLAVDRSLLEGVLAGGKYGAPSPGADQHNSLDWRWWALEFLPKPRRVRYRDQAGKPRWQLPFRINLFRARGLPEGATVHQSVVDRWGSLARYRPSNLPDPRALRIEPWSPGSVAAAREGAAVGPAPV